MENEKKTILRGLATISFYADDILKAKEWYTQFLGIAPYYAFPTEQQPAYIEFRIGDYEHEFGIIDKKYAPDMSNTQPGGAIAFWHVDDIEKTNEKLLSMGTTQYEPITQRGDGFVTASVVDPFGNLLGIMYNPHYLEILKSLKE
jgi:predicted enzyme related to lactoylglutathione lyase